MMIKKAASILIGSSLIAFGINYFLIPHHLINGGMIGVGLIANYAFDFRPGLTTIIVSLPLYVYAFIYYRSYFFNGLHGLLVSSFFIDLLYPLSTLPHTTNIVMSAIFGGIFIGTGVSLMLLVKVSTGGGDLLALIISSATTINVGLIIFTIDMFVILWGSFYLHETEIILYSLIMILMVGLTTYTITTKLSN